MEAIVIGGGIGGLATALSLHAAGIDCRVYEATCRIGALGVGITLLPQATKELEDLGLLPQLLARGTLTREVVYFTRSGDTIWREPRGLDAGYRWPQVAIHRGELHALLREAVHERLGADAIRIDSRAVDVTQHHGRATVQFRRSSDQAALPPDTADFVVAADGIHSSLRARFHPHEGPPKWGGRILWRGTTVAKPILDGATMLIAGTSRTKFVCYPIGQRDDGRQLIHWRADAVEPSSRFPRAADWNRRGSCSSFLQHYAGWSDRVVDIAALVTNASEVYEYPMSDRDPLPSWIFGRVALLGDAAHAMYPIGSNGAAQAILDARTLAFELATQPNLESALAAYDAARRPAMERLLLAHRSQGVDLLFDMLDARAPDGCEDLELILPYWEREELSLLYKWMAGSDLPALNESSPLTPPRGTGSLR